MHAKQPIVCLQLEQGQNTCVCVTIPIFKSLVRPTLEYGNTVWSNGLKKGITTIQIIHQGEKHEGRQDLKNCIYCRYYTETQQNVEEDLRSWEETSDNTSEESEDTIEDSDSDYELEVKTKKRKNESFVQVFLNKQIKFKN